MPIKPENRERYPKDWPEIRARILERAKNHCEWHDCKAHNGDTGHWEDKVWIKYTGPAGWRPVTFDGAAIRQTKIVLTIAHLNHTPEDCRPTNLAALCQRHHLAYDQEHHKQTAAATRRARANTLELFE